MNIDNIETAYDKIEELRGLQKIINSCEKEDLKGLEETIRLYGSCFLNINDALLAFRSAVKANAEARVKELKNIISEL